MLCNLMRDFFHFIAMCLIQAEFKIKHLRLKNTLSESQFMKNVMEETGTAFLAYIEWHGIMLIKKYNYKNI